MCLFATSAAIHADDIGFADADVINHVISHVVHHAIHVIHFIHIFF